MCKRDCRQQSFLCSFSRYLTYDAPKPLFQVQLHEKQKENDPLHLPTTTSFALPGTLAESKVKRKLQLWELTFNSSHIQKTHLAAWDLNISNTVINRPVRQIQFLAQFHHHPSWIFDIYTFPYILNDMGSINNVFSQWISRYVVCDFSLSQKMYAA